MTNVKFLVTSRETIIIAITIFTLIPIISKRHDRAGALSVIKAAGRGGVAPCKLGKGGSTKFSSLERTRMYRKSKAGRNRACAPLPKPCSVNPNRGPGTEYTEDADGLWELPLLKRITVDWETSAAFTGQNLAICYSANGVSTWKLFSQYGKTNLFNGKKYKSQLFICTHNSTYFWNWDASYHLATPPESNWRRATQSPWGESPAITTVSWVCSPLDWPTDLNQHWTCSQFHHHTTSSGWSRDV